MNILKKISFIIVISYIFNGCVIYRQTTLNPIYQTSEANLGTPVDGNGVNTDISGNVTNSSVNVNETLNTGGVITPVSKNNITSKNKTIVKRIPFPVNEYKSLATTGSATVKGQIYVIAPNGNKVFGRNTRLYLNPVTSYSTQWYNESYLGGAKMSKVDSRLFNYLKFTTSDTNGNFEFLNVPSGSYYLIGVVKCGTACGYDRVKNIRIAKKISVLGNSIKEEKLYKELH